MRYLKNIKKSAFGCNNVDAETYNDFFTLPFLQLQIQEFQ